MPEAASSQVTTSFLARLARLARLATPFCNVGGIPASENIDLTIFFLSTMYKNSAYYTSSRVILSSYIYFSFRLKPKNSLHPRWAKMSNDPATNMEYDDPNLILIVQTNSPETLELPHNVERYVGNVHTDESPRSSPSTTSQSDYIQHTVLLKFDKPPKNKKRGFVFGTDPYFCDIQLNRPRYQSPGRLQFSINYDREHRLVVRGLSTRKTAVSYDGSCGEEWRKNFTWILFSGYDLKVHLPSGITFDLIFPDHSSHQAQFREKVESYVNSINSEGQDNDSLDFEALNVRSNLTSQGNTTQTLSPFALPGQEEPIYLTDGKLGEGTYGRVYKTINVSTGDIYALKKLKLNGINGRAPKERTKEILKRLFKREADIMSRISHVSFFLPPPLCFLTCLILFNFIYLFIFLILGAYCEVFRVHR